MGKQNKFTPGPWEIDQDEKWIHIINRNSDIGPCIIPLNGGDMREEDIANARLIAAAPEMLEALEAIEAAAAYMPDVKNVEARSRLEMIRKYCKQAIAKAEGRE